MNSTLVITTRLNQGGTEYVLSPLTDSLGFLTRVVQVQICDCIRAAGEMDISPATLSLLRLVGSNRGILQAHAARILLIQESNMAILVKTVIAMGLIERRSQKGKRAGLWLTAEGELKVAQWERTAVIDRSYASVLSDAEYRQLIQLLSRVYHAALA